MIHMAFEGVRVARSASNSPSIKRIGPVAASGIGPTSPSDVSAEASTVKNDASLLAPFP